MFTHENITIIIQLEYQYRINDQSAFILNVQWREAKGGSTLRYSLYYEYMYKIYTIY
jgi:regulator of protease activity HflC (stomatin/prohibitin superfamily)